MDQQSWAESEQDIESEVMKTVTLVPNEKCAVSPPRRTGLTGHWTQDTGQQVARCGEVGPVRVKASSQAKLQAGHLHEDAGCRSEQD